MWIFSKKTEKKQELTETDRELLLDLAQRMVILEKNMAKWYLKQSPGRPKLPETPGNQPDTQVLAEDTKYKILKDGKIIQK